MVVREAFFFLFFEKNASKLKKNAQNKNAQKTP